VDYRRRRGTEAVARGNKGGYREMASSNQFPSIVDRLLCRVDISTENDCINWIGSSRGRYGIIYYNGKYHGPHRVVYELAHGGIPEGNVVHHSCGNSKCINPSHLEAMDSKSHTLMSGGITAQNKIKTHCRLGHPYDSGNTRHSKKGRSCRACARKRYWENRDANISYKRKFRAELRRRAGIS